MKSIVIDVREPSEYASDHVGGAINIPAQELFAGSKRLADIAKDTELVLYCNTGNRSSAAKNILAMQGYSHVVNGINKKHVEATYEQP